MKSWVTDDPQRPKARLVRLSDVTPERVAWIDRGRLALGKLNLLDGDPGLGKTLMALDYGARVSTGRAMPEGSASDVTEPAGVVVMTAEDGLGDTVRPRLEAVGADLDRVVSLEAVTDGSAERMPTAGDVAAIAEAIAAVQAKLVIIDPLMAYMPSATDSYRDQDVRRLLAGLAHLAAETGAALLVIRHLTKGSGGTNPLYRGGGSIGIIGAARVGLMVARDPDDESGERCILAPTKCNLTRPPAALAYRVIERNGVSIVQWEGTSAHTASDLVVAATAEQDDGGRRLEEACDYLRELLADGPLPSTQVQKQARGAGVRERTLWRAKRELKVRASKNGLGAWEWSLPTRNGSKRAIATPSPRDGRLGSLRHSSSNGGDSSGGNPAKSATPTDGRLRPWWPTADAIEQGDAEEDVL